VARLADLMEKKGLDAATLARRIGSQENLIRSLEQGNTRFVRPPVKDAVAKALGVNVYEIDEFQASFNAHA
jgi:transcriptional regulator with XRE-family HTH domain